MERDLGSIIQAILKRWEDNGFAGAAEGLKMAPRGASTGTEGLMLSIEFLLQTAKSDPKCMTLIRSELEMLIEYCSSTGIILNDSTVRTFYKP